MEKNVIQYLCVIICLKSLHVFYGLDKDLSVLQDSAQIH